MSEAAVKIGLVLGAGGVTGGAFHAGVLAALHQAAGWDARKAAIIVGTSAGSIAGTTLRAGLSPTDMLARAEGRPLSANGARLMRRVGSPAAIPPLRAAPKSRRPAEMASILGRAVARPFAAAPWALLAGLLPDGTVSTGMISSAIGGLFSERWPTDPLWLCAVHQRDGKRVVFGRDGLLPPLPSAVAASCAIPGFFAPVTIDGEHYVDGGLHSPTNADLLADAGVDLVIVSSPMSITGNRLRLGADQPVRRWSGALLDAEALRLRRRRIPVVAFQPTPDDAAVMGANALDPRRRAAVARTIYESTLHRLQRADMQSRLAALQSR